MGGMGGGMMGGMGGGMMGGMGGGMRSVPPTGLPSALLEPGPDPALADAACRSSHPRSARGRKLPGEGRAAAAR